MDSESPSTPFPPLTGVLDAARSRLAGLIQAHTPHDGNFELRLRGGSVLKVSAPHRELVHGIHRAAVCIVAQGAKRVLLGQEAFEYDASRMLVASVDVPVAGQITQASPAEPFLCFKLELDPTRIAELVPRVYPHGLPPNARNGAVYICDSDVGIMDAAARLLTLLAEPEAADLLVPLVMDEILIRLLRSPVGVRVAQVGQEASRVQRVAKAVAWVQAHFDQPLDVERLAGLVHMSPSTFHQHFKAVTSMSPLQFQKALRLQEARRLMLSRMMDAGTAGQQVGYLSTSQFTREYGRYFGQPPGKDIARLRTGGGA